MKGPVQKLENSHWGALTVQTMDDFEYQNKERRNKDK